MYGGLGGGEVMCKWGGGGRKPTMVSGLWYLEIGRERMVKDGGLTILNNNGVEFWACGSGLGEGCWVRSGYGLDWCLGFIIIKGPVWYCIITRTNFVNHWKFRV